MRALGEMAVPLLVTLAVLLGALRGVDVYGAMTEGAKKGLLTVWGILPSLLVILPAIRLLRASGLPELLGMADRIYVMNEGHLVAELQNDGTATQEKIMGYILRDSNREIPETQKVTEGVMQA